MTTISSSLAPEFALLSRRIVELYQNATLEDGSPRPVAGGITRLGKFEPLVAESRFDDRGDDALQAWLVDSLHLRIRQRQYSLAAIAIPQDPASRDALVEIRYPRRGWVERWRITLKEKRPGLVTAGEAIRLDAVEKSQLDF